MSKKSNSPELLRLAQRVLNQPLAIEAGKLSVILGVIGPRIGLLDIPVVAQRDDDFGKDWNTPDIAGDGQIAIIPVLGSLVQRKSGLDALSGLTSYEEVRSNFLAAMDDKTVEAILFRISSSGGEVAGLFDLVDEISDQRGRKPIYAFVDEEAYSAAYAIASAADKIFLPRTGEVGSIGVIAAHVDQSRWDEKTGVKVTYIYAGARKKDFNPHEPLSTEARTIAQQSVDLVWEIFAQTVAKNRNLSVQAVLDTEAGLYAGKAAVTEGLADDVKSFDEAIRFIVAEVATRKKEKQQMQFDDWRKATAEFMKNDATKGEAAEALTGLGFVSKEDLETFTREEAGKAARGARDEALEIVELCGLAGMFPMASGLIREGVSVDDARKRIMDARAEKGDGMEIVNSVNPLASGEGNPLIADAKRRAAGKEGK